MKPPSRPRKRPTFLEKDIDISFSDTEDEEASFSNSEMEPVQEDEDSMEEEISNADEALVSDSNPSMEEDNPAPGNNSLSLCVPSLDISLIWSPVWTVSVDVERIRSLSEEKTCWCEWTQEEMCGEDCTNRKERRECAMETCGEKCQNMVSTTTT